MLDFDVSFTLINVYGPTSTEDKLKIWDKLSVLIQLQNSHQVILGGDFNSILNQNEKAGGICPLIKTIQDFAQFFENNDLTYIQPSNGNFTWTNRRSGFAQIAARLDRFLLSHKWKLGNFHIHSEILSSPKSDHFPISINIDQSTSLDHIHHKSSFTFESMRLHHPHFLPLLNNGGSMLLFSWV